MAQKAKNLPPDSVSAADQMSVCGFFIIEGKKLEAQSWLLTSSLRKTHPDWQIIAYTTHAYLPHVSAGTRRMLDDHGAELRLLPQGQRIWNKPYPHGNKILAAAEPRDTDWSIFFDTDICVCSPIELDSLNSIGKRVLLVPEGVPTWGGEQDRWLRAYEHFGLPLPEKSVQLVRHRRLWFYPYFNAGFIAFPEICDGTRFGAEWLYTALDIDHHLRVAHKRPWLDQIALPLTTARLGWENEVLPDLFNYSTKNREVEEGPHPIVAHYHRDPGFVNWPNAQAQVDVLNAYIRSKNP